MTAKPNFDSKRPNFDRQRQDALRAMHDARIKADIKAKKDAERLANQAPVLDDTVQPECTPAMPTFTA